MLNLYLEGIVVDVCSAVDILAKKYENDDIDDESKWPKYEPFTACVGSDEQKQRTQTPYVPTLADQRYRSTLCNILLGLWDREALDSAKYEIKTVLNTLSLFPRETALPRIDAKLLDAGYIESRGPFRFIETQYLDEHLTIDEKQQIRFYSNWNRWPCLVSHAVLRGHDAEATSFDAVSSADRYSTVSLGVRGAMRELYFELLTHGYLLFFQYTMGGKGKASSSKIAKRINIPIVEPKKIREYSKIPIGPYGDDIQDMMNTSVSYARSAAFKYRLDELNETLKNWQPQGIMELRYRGYGAVDPVGRYLLYFILIFGFIAILGLAGIAAQTVAAYKQLYLSEAG